jgi:hypothetical protein
MKFILLLIYICFSIFSHSQNTTALQTVLKKSGNNAKELNAVIDNYSKHPKDSLKLKAAIFLIENNDGHLSYQSDNWNLFCNEFKKVSNKSIDSKINSSPYDSLFTAYESKLYDFKEIEDYTSITSTYLINNIDSAFIAWKKPFGEHLSFNEFCEYLLPYKIGDEIFEPWRNYFSTQFLPFVTNLTLKELYSISSNDVCNKLKSNINAKGIHWPYPIPDLPPSILTKLERAPCIDLSRLIAYAGRSLGIPIVVDYTPQWANRSSNHVWNALIDKSGKPLSFGAKDEVELGRHLEGRPWERVSKVYRMTYAIQHNSLAYICGSEEIHDKFVSPFIKDVSKDYFNGADLKINFINEPKFKCSFAYLSTFDDRNWTPVAWSKIQNNSIIFNNINTRVVYLPVYYINGNTIPADYPMLVFDSVNNLKLKPDFSKTQTVIVRRKYNNAKTSNFGIKMKGCKFQVANKEDFSDAVDLFDIINVPEICYNTVVVKNDLKYKHFRYYIPNNSIGEVAEIEVYEEQSDKKLSGLIFEYNKAFKKEINFSRAFDNNVLTCYQKADENSIGIGIEFDEPKQISKIVFLPRNDDNFIRDGELYEMFYWDNKWVSLGRQTGSIKTQSLTYTNAPNNALFLLRNLTKGREERIFTYENGKQVWW